MRQTLDLQQSQLQLLYRRLQDKSSGEAEPYSLRDEIPPHY